MNAIPHATSCDPKMHSGLTRRQFQAAAARATLSGAWLIGVACRGPQAERQTPQRELGNSAAGPCVFQASFMTWDLPPRPDSRPHARHNIPLGNRARIQLDSIISVIDEKADSFEQFVLIAPCRTEWVYADKGLFQIPSREYRNIYSLKEERQMGRGITYDGAVTRGRPVTDTFRSIEIDVQRFRRFRVLETPAAINEATENNIPLIGRTEVREPAGGKRYVLEYPIKTMNFRPENSSFQVDTGPLLMPDLESDQPKSIDRLQMAHIAYNRLDRAEFIVRAPTAVTDARGQEVAQVLHYSEIRECPAVTQILTGEGC